MSCVIEDIKLFFPELKSEDSTDMPCLVVPADKLLPVVTKLKERGFNYLSGLTAVDYIEENQIEMVYFLMTVPQANELKIKVRLDREKPEIASLTAIWPAADAQEREVYDLMGVIFTGHGDLKRILCPDDFEGHPLRKDFKLRKEEREE